MISESQSKGDLVREISPKQFNKKSYTYGDYLTWNDNQRYELIDGIIYIMSPAPGRCHQKITGEIYR